MDKEEEDTEEDKIDMVSRKDRPRNDHVREIGTAARRYSQRDHQLGAILLPEVVLLFISVQKNGGVAEINFRFPRIFR